VAGEVWRGLSLDEALNARPALAGAVGGLRLNGVPGRRHAGVAVTCPAVASREAGSRTVTVGEGPSVI
jgi:hypothetical protein